MKSNRHGPRLGRPCAIVLLNIWLVSATWAAPQFKVLHAFGSGTDGGGLYSGVVFDQRGNLYGNTSGGGVNGYGTVFKLKRQPGGDWAEKILHSFKNGDPDGQEPNGTLAFDSAGNFYGTTQLGGANHLGTAFQMKSGPTGWVLSVIYSFCAQPDCTDSGSTSAGLVMDAANNLYGASNTAFELSPSNGGWIESVLYTFCSQPDCTDGTGAYAGLILDKNGTLYGTTNRGGSYDGGTAFKVKHLPDGSWGHRVLHSFGGSPKDGRAPGVGALALDQAGSLYGTTGSGGKNNCGNAHCGTIFELTPQPSGHWKETILHHFKLGKNGYWPGAGVVIDNAGSLYGTTVSGGSNCDCGVVYKLSPNPDGTWTYTVLHRFTGFDGAQPDANLILDDQGNLYGTAITGGAGGFGVVFEITP